MITLTRFQARQVRAVFLRTLNGSARGSGPVPIQIQADTHGLRLRAGTSAAAVEFCDPRPFAPETLTVPVELLTQSEGRTHDLVTIERSSPDEVLASWTDEGVPQLRRYPLVTASADFPPTPASWSDNPGELLDALQAATQTADREASRYALHRWQLRGDSGQVVATDGRQLLLQGGFTFPWPGHLLVTPTTVFGSRELPRPARVQVARTDLHVCLRAGCFTFWLAIDTQGRFPDVDRSMKQPTEASATIEIAEADAAYVIPVLDRLPGGDEPHGPLTVEANGSILLRSRSDQAARPTEVLLPRSRLAGDPLQLNTNRHYLRRALQLGFRQLHVFGQERTVLCQDAQRSYVWALLAADDALPPASDAMRIEPPECRPGRQTMAGRRPGGRAAARLIHATDGARAATPDEVLASLAQLQCQLRDALAQASQFQRWLRRQHKLVPVTRAAAT
ncbi:MAG: hypothetical protein AB7F89_26580 [Pirellulaceae bacterium]